MLQATLVCAVPHGVGCPLLVCSRPPPQPQVSPPDRGHISPWRQRQYRIFCTVGDQLATQLPAHLRNWESAVDYYNGLLGSIRLDGPEPQVRAGRRAGTCPRRGRGPAARRPACSGSSRSAALLGEKPSQGHFQCLSSAVLINSFRCNFLIDPESQITFLNRNDPRNSGGDRLSLSCLDTSDVDGSEPHFELLLIKPSLTERTTRLWQLLF